MAGHPKKKAAREAAARAAEQAAKEAENLGKVKAAEFAGSAEDSARAEGKSRKGAKKKPEPLTPEQIAKKEVTGVGTRMKKLLREGGKYEAALTYQVEQAATTLTIARKIAAEILTTASAVEKETSREGHGRVKINPLFELYLKFDSANRHNLRALSMNRENMRTADDQLDDGEDAVMKLLQKMAQDDDGE